LRKDSALVYRNGPGYGRHFGILRGNRLERATGPGLGTGAVRERPLVLSASTARAGERACAAIRLADDRLPGHWEPLARLLLRN